MRRIVLSLLFVLLSLQWATASAGTGCAHGAAQHGHLARTEPGQARAPAARERIDQDARAPRAAAAAAGAHPGHAGHPGHAQADTEAARTAHPTRTDAAASAMRAEPGGCPLGDCDRCCRGGGTAPPAARTASPTAALASAPQPPIDLSPVSPALDGPFRPPRRAAA